LRTAGPFPDFAESVGLFAKVGILGDLFDGVDALLEGGNLLDGVDTLLEGTEDLLEGVPDRADRAVRLFGVDADRLEVSVSAGRRLVSDLVSSLLDGAIWFARGVASLDEINDFLVVFVPLLFEVISTIFDSDCDIFLVRREVDGGLFSAFVGDSLLELEFSFSMRGVSGRRSLGDLDGDILGETLVIDVDYFPTKPFLIINGGIS
jgi:hypothetical protein